MMTGCAFDVRGNHLEKLITCIMTQAVVNAFEVVNIEKHDRQHAVVAGALNQLFGKQLIETTTVDQVGQRIVMGNLLQ